MIKNRRVIVVMPAYNAEKTLEKTVSEVDRSIVDEIVLVDDFSRDETFALAKRLGLQAIRHDQNRGYGGNQKSCYQAALRLNADIVIMVHPDYQYTPKLIPAMAELIASGLYDVVLASRILGGGALSGGMPLYKYISNRFLTFVENLMTGMKLSEYHTGYRAFSRKVLEKLPIEENDDDFIFDNQMLVQAHMGGFRIAEVTCPTKYFPEASSINFKRSLKYGLSCLWVGFQCLMAKKGLARPKIFRGLFRAAAIASAIALSWTAEAAPKKKGIPSVVDDDEGAFQGVVVKGSFGFAFVDPQDLNDDLRAENKTAQKAGYPNYSLDEVGHLWAIDLYAGYRFFKDIDFGVSFSWPGQSSVSETQFHEKTGIKLEREVTVGMSVLAVRGHYTIFEDRQIRIYAGPTAGIAFFTLTSETQQGALVSKIVARSTGPYLKAASGGEYFFTENWGIFFEGGFAYAKSDPLIVEERTGTTIKKGDTLAFGGKDAVLDLSGFVVSAGITFFWPI